MAFAPIFKVRSDFLESQNKDHTTSNSDQRRVTIIESGGTEHLIKLKLTFVLYRIADSQSLEVLLSHLSGDGHGQGDKGGRSDGAHRVTELKKRRIGATDTKDRQSNCGRNGFVLPMKTEADNWLRSPHTLLLNAWLIGWLAG